MVERGATPEVSPLHKRALKGAQALTTPLLPDDYIELMNPMWSTRELRGRIERIQPETADASTVVIRPSLRWPGHQPGQYLRIGVEIDGVRHWRAYSLTSDPDHPEGLVSITVKHVREGQDVAVLHAPDRARGDGLPRRGRGDLRPPRPAAAEARCSSAPAAGSRRS